MALKTWLLGYRHLYTFWLVDTKGKPSRDVKKLEKEILGQARFRRDALEKERILKVIKKIDNWGGFENCLIKYSRELGDYWQPDSWKVKVYGHVSNKPENA